MKERRKEGKKEGMNDLWQLIRFGDYVSGIIYGGDVEL